MQFWPMLAKILAAGLVLSVLASLAYYAMILVEKGRGNDTDVR